MTLNRRNLLTRMPKITGLSNALMMDFCPTFKSGGKKTSES
jgi:hypothetical protein